MNLREDLVTDRIDAWLAGLFDRERRASTSAVLLAAHNDDTTDIQRQSLRQRVLDAESRLARHLAAIEAGVDPQALVVAMNTAQADKAAAEAELNGLPKVRRFTETEIRKLVDALGDIRAVLTAGHPTDKAQLYQSLGLQARYQHLRNRVIVGATPLWG
ncbi:hypothetical protein [Nocardia carnea]|uniref:hypothetical protein n=1 Tax=Nocardia carnea TaxID=37328 RepID=UPI002454916D|nr:hypothetical protein [Nocardia carnea]